MGSEPRPNFALAALPSALRECSLAPGSPGRLSQAPQIVQERAPGAHISARSTLSGNTRRTLRSESCRCPCPSCRARVRLSGDSRTLAGRARAEAAA